MEVVETHGNIFSKHTFYTLKFCVCTHMNVYIILLRCEFCFLLLIPFFITESYQSMRFIEEGLLGNKQLRKLYKTTPSLRYYVDQRADFSRIMFCDPFCYFEITFFSFLLLFDGLSKVKWYSKSKFLLILICCYKMLFVRSSSSPASSMNLCYELPSSLV